jgi:diguanylate cyclase (GGDEF)-like protein/PAS domain S-box-containing protein
LSPGRLPSYEEIQQPMSASRRRGHGLRLTARFRWAAVLLLLPLLGLAAVSGTGLVVSANASAALDHAQELNVALATLDEDVQHFGLTALDVLIGHQADDLGAMTAAETQVDADFAVLARATGFTAAQLMALPLVASAWSATISNRDAIRRLTSSVQKDAAAANLLEDAIDADERLLTSRVAAVEQLGAAHVAGLRQERDAAVLASAVAVGLALMIGIAIAAWLSNRLAQSVLRPLRILRTATSRLAAGDRSVRIDSVSGDEIAELGDAFDSMAGELEQEQDAVLARERRLVALVENTNDGIVVISAAGAIEFATPSFREYLDGEDGAPRFADIVHPDDLERVSAAWREGLLLSDGSTFEVKARLKHRDGGWHHVWAKVTNRLGDAGVAGMVVNINDVSERHEHEEQLAFQAQHDVLTGLANRGLFRERLERVAATTGEARVHSVLYIDLDDFKRINDTLGHQAGDDLLLAVGERLVASVRPEDLVARLGSDEFAILLDRADAHMAVTAAKRILGALQRPLTLGGRDVLPRASVGIASAAPGGIGGDSLLGDADLAMYFAKRNGKAQYRVFSPEMRTDLVDRLQLGEDLRAAIESGSIEVNYQPIIDMRSGAIVGAETLARWHHPTRGWVGPAVFIALAEELNLVERIDAVVLREACAQGRAWADAGLPSLRIAVNLSGSNLNNPDLVANVAATLADSGFKAANLELELTEGVVIAESEGTLGTLEGLKALGLRLAIDDFGTGYSVLSRLRTLPFDTLKVDKIFVDELDAVHLGSTLAESILDMARVLGLKVVAEGVETSRQADFLRSHGCDFAQGYLFSRPVGAAAFEALVRAAGSTRAADTKAAVA